MPEKLTFSDAPINTEGILCLTKVSLSLGQATCSSVPFSAMYGVNETVKFIRHIPFCTFILNIISYLASINIVFNIIFS